MHLISAIRQDPRRLLRLIILACIPLSLALQLRDALRSGTIADPVMFRLEGLTGDDTNSISLFEDGGPRDRNLVPGGPEPATWHLKDMWVFQLEFEMAHHVASAITGANIEIGSRRFQISSSEMKSQWLVGTSDRTNSTGVNVADVALFRLPESIRAESSRFSNKTRRINWPGDEVAIGRLASTVIWPTFKYSLPLLLVLFLPKRLAPLRYCRGMLRAAMRRPAICNMPESGSGIKSWFDHLLGLALVIGGLTFLEWRIPYYFAQDDVIAGELPPILCGLRGVWAGYLPQWNPYVGMGAPLMGAGGYSLTYPPIYICYAVARHVFGDEYAVLEVFAFLHVLAGFILCRRVCKIIGFTAFASNLASLSFVFSGPILIFGRVWHTFIPLCVWIPALALCIETLRRRNVGWKWLGITAICLAMPVHVGFPQMAVVCFGLFCSLVVALVVTRQISWTAVLKGIAAVTLGLSLSVPLLRMQKELGEHTQGQVIKFTSKWDAQPGLAAMFLPAPIVTAKGFVDLPRPDFTHFYFFGGVLAWCWALGSLLVMGKRIHNWNAGASLWWWTAMAFYVLSLGNQGMLWRVLGNLPVISNLVRYPVRMLPFFVFAAVISGGYIFDRIWRRTQCYPILRALAGGAALALLGYHLTRVDTAVTYFAFRPYPKVPCIERLRDADPTSIRRVCSLVSDLSTEASYSASLGSNMACVHEVFSVNIYDVVVTTSALYTHAADEMQRDLRRALTRYGVRWLIVDSADIHNSDVHDSASGAAEYSMFVPWGGLPVSELRDSLIKATGQEFPKGVSCGPMQWFEIQSPDALVFRAEAPAEGLPFRIHTEGLDVDVSNAGSPLKKGTVPVDNVDLSRETDLLERDSPLFQRPAGGSDVVVNFLRLDAMTASVDGHDVACKADDWGRIVVSVPEGASQLAIRYRPKWGRGMPLAVILAGIAVTIFFSVETISMHFRSTVCTV